MNRIRIVLLAGALLAPLAGVADAPATDAELALLRQQVAQLTERLAALEAANRRVVQETSAVAAKAEATAATVSRVEATVDETVAKQVKEETSDLNWARRISWKGDFRYRYENIDEEGRDSRDRQRIRARPAFTAIVNDDVKVGFGLATGGDDPVSTNQTLGKGGSTKDAKIDLAYFDWQATDHLAVSGGKFKNPLHRAGGNGLVWDSDWRPEGFYLAYEKNDWFATAAGSSLESDTKGDKDVFAYLLQGGMETKLDNGMKLSAGIGYYSVPLKGELPVFDPEDGGGNTLDSEGRFAFDYDMIEAYAELGFTLGGKPASVFADVVKNNDADDFDTGWAVGGKFGKAGDLGTWELGYVYQDLEADAVIGLLTDSDFGGGGTDGKGHRLSGGYGLGKGWKLNFTYFINEIDGNAEDVGRGVEHDYDRLQLDIGFKY